MPCAGERVLGVEPVETQSQRRHPELLAEAVSLELAAEPRTGGELTKRREVLGPHIACSDDLAIDDHGELQVPGLGSDRGTRLPVEPHRLTLHLWRR